MLVLDLFLPRGRKHLAMPFAFVGVAASLLATLSLVGDPRSTFDGAYVVDNYAVLFKTFFLVTALVVLLISYRYVKDGRYYQGEYYFLLLCSFLGMVTMPSSRDLLMLFISLELVSAPAFLLAGFRKTDPRSNEAALKFFLIGVLSTAVMLYGMSLVYGITGSITLSGIAEGLAGATGRQPIVLAAILLVVVGFAFKVSSVPFQFWAPDTYEGAPVPIAAFLSVGSKAAGFAGLLQLMFVAFIGQAEFWAPIFAVLSILTMTLGNLVAMQQRQVVRLLAYSSIAQAGYMLLPFALAGQSASLDATAFAAVVLYILIYGAMNLGTFAIVIGESGESSGLLVSDFAGFGIRAPALAVAMTTFLVSLAGIPPTAGFWAKFVDLRRGHRARRLRPVARRGHGRQLGDLDRVLLRRRPCHVARPGGRTGPTGPVPGPDLARGRPGHAHRAGRGDLPHAAQPTSRRCPRWSGSSPRRPARRHRIGTGRSAVRSRARP